MGSSMRYHPPGSSLLHVSDPTILAAAAAIKVNWYPPYKHTCAPKVESFFLHPTPWTIITFRSPFCTYQSINPATIYHPRTWAYCFPEFSEISRLPWQAGRRAILRSGFFVIIFYFKTLERWVDCRWIGCVGIFVAFLLLFLIARFLSAFHCRPAAKYLSFSLSRNNEIRKRQRG